MTDFANYYVFFHLFRRSSIIVNLFQSNQILVFVYFLTIVNPDPKLSFALVISNFAYSFYLLVLLIYGKCIVETNLYVHLTTTNHQGNACQSEARYPKVPLLIEPSPRLFTRNNLGCEIDER